MLWVCWNVLCSVSHLLNLLLTFLIKQPLICLNLSYLCGLIGILFEVFNRLDGSSHLQRRFIVLNHSISLIQLIFDLVSKENNSRLGSTCRTLTERFSTTLTERFKRYIIYNSRWFFSCDDIYNMLGWPRAQVCPQFTIVFQRSMRMEVCVFVSAAVCRTSFCWSLQCFQRAHFFNHIMT